MYLVQATHSECLVFHGDSLRKTRVALVTTREAGLNSLPHLHSTPCHNRLSLTHRMPNLELSFLQWIIGAPFVSFVTAIRCSLY